MTESQTNDKDETRTIDITVTKENLRDDLFKIFSQLFGGNSRDEVEYEELTGGYINSIERLSLKTNKSKSLVFRTFGLKFDGEEFMKNFKEQKPTTEETDSKNAQNSKFGDTDISKIIFSRSTEYKIMNVISKHGLCKPVYAKYNNGMCYGYTEGQTLSGALMLTNDFLNEMSTKLARFHSIKYDIPEIPYKTHYDRIYVQAGPAFEMMLLQIDEQLGDKLKQYPHNQLPPIKKILEDDKNIMKLVTEIGFGQIVFAHNDANQRNIIWNPQERTLDFIDFEMTMNNYAFIELGYLFNCYCGHFLYDFDPQLFPNANYRRCFLKNYLKEFNLLNGIKLDDEQFANELEELIVRSELGVLIHIVRLVSAARMLDMNPNMFKNEDLIAKRGSKEFFCTEWSINLYELYADIKDEFIQRAQKHLESKKEKETKV